MVNTNSGAKLYICATAQLADLDAAGFAALTWVRVTGVGSVGEIGNNQNILTYDTWDNDVVQKAKGMVDAGSPDVEVARDTTDAGQDALRTAAATNSPYAIKIERNDKLTGGGTNTLLYNRALIVGPRRPQGRNEDFDLEIYQFGLVQREVVVDPT